MPENRQGQSNGTVLAMAGACGGTRHSAGSGPRGMERTAMGLTIVHKSDLTTRKKNPRVALVLAGGAVTGGAYKLGGLKALDDFLVNRKTTDFDIYVGLSAGSFLAAPLAGGVTPVEMLKSLDGPSPDSRHRGPRTSSRTYRACSTTSSSRRRDSCAISRTPSVARGASRASTRSSNA